MATGWMMSSGPSTRTKEFGLCHVRPSMTKAGDGRPDTIIYDHIPVRRYGRARRDYARPEHRN
jgi:hypothetical protein